MNFWLQLQEGTLETWVKNDSIVSRDVINLIYLTALHFPQYEIIPYAKGSLRWNKKSNSSNNELAKGVAKYVFVAL